MDQSQKPVRQASVVKTSVQATQHSEAQGGSHDPVPSLSRAYLELCASASQSPSNHRGPDWIALPNLALTEPCVEKLNDGHLDSQRIDSPSPTADRIHKPTHTIAIA